MVNTYGSLRDEIGNHCDTRAVRAFSRVLRVVLLGSALAGLAHAQQLERTVAVSPVLGDPQASGRQLLDVVSSLSPTPDDPWLVKIEPGVYDLGTDSLVLVPGLEVEGSGEDVTVIQGLGRTLDGAFDRGKGVVNGADRASLHDLTVRCVTDERSDREGCICIANVDSAPRLHDLTLESRGFGIHWGIRNTASSPLVEEVTIELQDGADNYGIVNAFGSFPAILRSTISSRHGSNLNIGILDRNGGAPAVIEDSQIFALGGTEAIGIYEDTGGPLARVRIDDGVVEAAEAQVNTGILGKLHRLEIQGAVISGDVAIDLGLTGEVNVTSSELIGEGTLVQAGVVRLGATRLSAGGGVHGVSETVCAGVYVLSMPAEFYATECPASDAPRRGLGRLRKARRVLEGELG